MQSWANPTGAGTRAPIVRFSVAMWWIALLLAAIAVSLGVLWHFSGPSARITDRRLGRLLRIGRLSARLSASWLGARIRLLFAGQERRKRIDAARRRDDAARVAETMGQMKGVFMKLGQMMSFISDDVPTEYRSALQLLQASAPPMDFALIRDVAEREIGRPLERAFARFDVEPIASASIGQVHRAQLPTGEEVAVKIQYPGVADAIRADLANVATLYRMMTLLYPAIEPEPIIAELRARIFEELDYSLEARNQRAFAELYDGHPFVRVPRVFDRYSTMQVLTTEYVAGRRFSEILGAPEAERMRYGEILYRFVFGSIARFGVFNGDPQPGNYLFDEDGNVVFLDFGCIKYFPEPMLRRWRSAVETHVAGDRDAFRQRLIELGFFKPENAPDATLLYDHFSYFYEPISADRPFTFSREYNARSFKVVLKPEGRFAVLAKTLNLPPDFVLVNRIQWGVFSILGQLGATANWHLIQREFFHGETSHTELGHLDVAHHRRWLAARGFEGTEVLLGPEGLRPRSPPIPN